MEAHFVFVFIFKNPHAFISWKHVLGLFKQGTRSLLCDQAQGDLLPKCEHDTQLTQCSKKHMHGHLLHVASVVNN